MTNYATDYFHGIDGSVVENNLGWSAQTVCGSEKQLQICFSSSAQEVPALPIQPHGAAGLGGACPVSQPLGLSSAA